MAEQLQIEAPAFDRIRKGDNHAIEDGIRLLWLVANNEISVRSQTVTRVLNRIAPKVLSAAPTSAQDNYDPGDCGWLLFTGSTAFNWTGIRNGYDGRTLLVENLGSATITLKYENAGSDAANRFYMRGAADVTLATGQTTLLGYHNSRWRVATFI